jgi:hypothetical protein
VTWIEQPPDIVDDAVGDARSCKLFSKRLRIERQRLVLVGILGELAEDAIDIPASVRAKPEYQLGWGFEQCSGRRYLPPTTGGPG